MDQFYLLGGRGVAMDQLYLLISWGEGAWLWTNSTSWEGGGVAIALLALHICIFWYVSQKRVVIIIHRCNTLMHVMTHHPTPRGACDDTPPSKVCM